MGFKIYSLKLSFKEIIAHFEKQKMKEFDEIQSNIKRLKDSIPIVAKSYSGEAYATA